MARNPPRTAPRAPANRQEGFVGGRGHGRAARGGRGGRGSAARVHQQPDQSVGSLVDDSSLLESGLTFVGFPSARQKVREALNHQQFRAFYGVSPKAVTLIFCDVKAKNNNK